MLDLPGKIRETVLLYFATAQSIFLIILGKIIISCNRKPMELSLKNQRFLIFSEGIEKDHLSKIH